MDDDEVLAPLTDEEDQGIFTQAEDSVPADAPHRAREVASNYGKHKRASQLKKRHDASSKGGKGSTPKPLVKT